MGESFVINGRNIYIYGESTYFLRPWVLRPFIPKLAFINEMSSLKVLVENKYRDLKQLWCSKDYPRRLKVRAVPIGILYRASAIMLNRQTCIY